MNRRHCPPLRSQRGEINWPRLLTVCAILAALLVVPMVFLKNRAKARNAAAPAVPGFLLSSLEDANARCAGSLGTGWRLASFHDGGGWELHGQGLVGTLADRRDRVWVTIGDQPGNCWDKP